MTWSRPRSAFTLLELLVVITLMSMAMGMVAFRLDGLTTSGSLRSAAAQLGSLVRLTRTQARTTGSPRLFEYLPGGDRIVVRAATKGEGLWRWDRGIEFLTGTRAHIQRVVIEGEPQTSSDEYSAAIRIRADGRYRSHAVVLELNGQYAVVVFHGAAEPRYVVPDRMPQAVTFELLMLELERGSEAG